MASPEELLGMVFIAILVAGVFYLWFSGEAKGQPAEFPKEAMPACESDADCSTNPDGIRCMSVESSPVFCGCLDKDDCRIGGNLCENFKCK